MATARRNNMLEWEANVKCKSGKQQLSLTSESGMLAVGSGIVDDQELQVTMFWGRLGQGFSENCERLAK
jgi:hypothetical protein